ncbi:hypothetical protein BDM02DRAFT_836011 [Thelephora ganbajun]|uniref:Uncharacterized protein n=1 Tax=Thelephora ganbajun TaxID=370292 RepID=A0ACB6Z5T0_THEGA|nr:hypothetical protein BDM02DRAFT_836011 [Thelephora ganbajun]
MSEGMGSDSRLDYSRYGSPHPQDLKCGWPDNKHNCVRCIKGAEELIGADSLPSTHAMMLFKWPISVDAVDPINTLTPGRHRNGSAPQRSTPSMSQRI